MQEDVLNIRLRNCLVTILELESALRKTSLGPLLSAEFTTLKQVMRRLETVDINESDVHRVEAATSRFLGELKDIPSGEALSQDVQTKVLQ